MYPSAEPLRKFMTHSKGLCTHQQNNKAVYDTQQSVVYPSAGTIGHTRELYGYLIRTTKEVYDTAGLCVSNSRNDKTVYDIQQSFMYPSAEPLRKFMTHSKGLCTRQQNNKAVYDTQQSVVYP